MTDDTSIHLLNRLYCVIFLIILIILVGSKQYVGKPIACWCPAMFTRQHVKYADDYCWISNTYYVDFKSDIPSGKELRTENEIEYYQWVPLILAFQAFLFYLPRIIWKQFGSYTFINIKKILIMAEDATYLIGAKRDEAIEDIVSYLEKYIQIRNCASSSYRKMDILREQMAKVGLHYGNCLVLLFMMTSILYMMSAMAQFVLLDVFLGNDFKNFGFDFIAMIFKGKELEDTRRFPRVTFCDLDVRQMTNVQTWTVQCSLPINLFNEKLFFFDWFMLVVMITMNSIHCLCLFILIFLPSCTENFICNFLELGDFSSQQRNLQKFREVQHDFVRNYLRNDGAFIIWLLRNKTNPIITAEIVNRLWNSYSKQGLVEAKLHADEDNYLTTTNI